MVLCHLHILQGDYSPRKPILLKFEKYLCVCLSANSSAVYGSTGTKLGREVGEGLGIRLETFVSMATIQLSRYSRKTLLRLTYWADGHGFLYIKSTQPYLCACKIWTKSTLYFLGTKFCVFAQSKYKWLAPWPPMGVLSMGLEHCHRGKPPGLLSRLYSSCVSTCDRHLSAMY